MRTAVGSQSHVKGRSAPTNNNYNPHALTRDASLRRVSVPTFSRGHPVSGRVMPFVVPGCKEDPPLRLNGTKVHLTYAGLYRDELSHRDIFSKAREWGASRHP